MAPGESISGLEDEWRLSGGKPKLIYVKRTPAREQRLEELLRSIEREDRACYRPFRDASELTDLVSDDLALLLTERFARPLAVDEPSPEVDAPPPWSPPLERSEMLGREGVPERIEALLARKDTAIVTLTGPGGSGKTRLAVHMAHTLHAAFPDGCYYVPLASVRESKDVIPAITAVLQVPMPPSGGDPARQLSGFLRSKTALLVLDNFEQVLGAAPAVSGLVSGCPHVKALVTSREALGIAGEKLFPVPLLPHGAHDARSPAMELFEQRARDVAALRFATDTPEESERAWRLFSRYIYALMGDARGAVALEWSARFASRPRAADPMWAARGDSSIGWVGSAGMGVADPDRLARGIADLERLGETQFLPGALCAHGMSRMMAGESDGLGIVERSVRVAEDRGYAFLEGWGRTLICYNHLITGNLDQVWVEMRTLESRARAAENTEGVSFATAIRGRLELASGDLGLARATFAEAFALARERSARWARSDALFCLASVALALGDLAAARQILEESVELALDMGAGDYLSLAFAALADVVLDTDGRDVAAALLAQSEEGPLGVDVAMADPTGTIVAAMQRARTRLGPLTDAERATPLEDALKAIRRDT